MFKRFTLTLLVLASIAASAQADMVYQWIKPVSVQADSYYYLNDQKGLPELAIDDDNYTGWIMQGLGNITFDLGGQYSVSAIQIYWGGSVSNGNIADVYVDDELVVSKSMFGAWTNTRNLTTPVEGRYVSYETLPLEHYPGQVAGYSEISNILVYAAEVPEPATAGLLLLGSVAFLKRKKNCK